MFKKMSRLIPFVLVLAACSNSTSADPANEAENESRNSSPTDSPSSTNLSPEDVNITTFEFEDDGTIPNNPKFSVLVYHNPFGGETENIEETFNNNNWSNSWTNGIFNYHHFHSNAHEVLGIAAGNARVHLGGENGEIVEVSAGDVLVLPSGTGHKRVEASEDFSVIGAYPNGASPDLETEANDEFRQNIKDVPRPDTDPVFGNQGPLLEQWEN